MVASLSATLKKTHDIGSSDMGTYAVYIRPPDHTENPSIEERGEKRVCTRVSTPS